MNREVAEAVAVGEVEEEEAVAEVQGEDAIRWILRKVECLRGDTCAAFLHFGVLVSSRIPYELLDPRPCLGEDGTLGQDRKVCMLFQWGCESVTLYSPFSNARTLEYDSSCLAALSSSDQVTSQGVLSMMVRNSRRRRRLLLLST